MKAVEVASRLGAEVFGSAADSVEIEGAYASDRMSDLLNEVDDHTLLVTNLSHAALSRPVELMDVAAVCLLNGVVPPPELLAAMERQGSALLVSPYGMYETCGRLFQILTASFGSKVR